MKDHTNRKQMIKTEQNLFQNRNYCFDSTEFDRLELLKKYITQNSFCYKIKSNKDKF